MYRKASASPTVYKGTVYYPVYEPPAGSAACSVGNAFICSADDECGTNNSVDLGKIREGDKCFFVTEGILSEVVVFGDTLYANVAGPSRTQDTLVQVLAGSGEVVTYRRSWREGF